MKILVICILTVFLLVGCATEGQRQSGPHSSPQPPKNVKVEYLGYKGKNGPLVYAPPSRLSSPRQLGIGKGTVWQPRCGEETFDWAKTELSELFLRYQQNQQLIQKNQNAIQQLEKNINDINRGQIEAEIARRRQENTQYNSENSKLACQFVKKHIQTLGAQVPLSVESPYFQKGMEKSNFAVPESKMKLNDEQEAYARVNQPSLYRKYQMLKDRKRKVEVVEQQIADVCQLVTSDTRLDNLPVFQLAKLDCIGICLELQTVVEQVEKLRTDEMIRSLE